MSNAGVLDNISKLREAARRLASGEPMNELGIWLAAALRNYLAHAAQGLTLEAALDLDCDPGQHRWWTQRNLTERDAIIRKIADEHFPELEVGAAARAIVREATRYHMGSRRLERDVVPAERSGSVRELLRRALSAGDGQFPESARHVRRILDDRGR